jgi:hypothetical protein
MKRQFIKYIINLIIALSVLQSHSQDLIQINKDYYFFNGIVLDGEVILSTSKGLVKYDNSQILPYTKVSNNYNGYIKFRDNKIVKGEFVPSDYLNRVLPDRYLNIKYAILFHDNLIFAFINGDMLVYEQLIGSRTDLQSNVTGITNGYFSTPKGVFDYNQELQRNLPGFSLGKIRSISHGIAVCWGGIYIQYKNEGYDFSDNKNLFKVGNQVLGQAKDIIELSTNKYLVTSSKGVYILDIQEEKVSPILDNPYALPAKIKILNNNISLISLGENLYLMDTRSNSLEKYYTHNETIIDYHFNEKNKIIYILDKNGLVEIAKIDNKRFRLVQKEYNEISSLAFFSNTLLIINQNAIDVFDLTSSKAYYNLFNNSFNPQSYYIENDVFQIGSNTGIDKITPNALRSAIFVDSYRSLISDERDNTLLIIIIFLLALSVLYLIYLVNNKRNHINKILSQATNFTLEEKVKKYISNNLSTVTVDKIKNEFNLTNIYEIFSEETPGEFIRTQRIKKVKKMRKERFSEEEIAKATGFSVSYLKKI